MNPFNYDLSTPEGLQNAVAWQQALVERMADQARWIVPRSMSVIVLDKVNKQAIRVMGMSPEPTIKRVFEEMGWTWIDKAEFNV